MSRKPTEPKYLRIKNAILQDVRNAHLMPGQKVDSISEIVERFKVSKVTAVHALAALEAEGIVRREHGRGTFVTEQSDEAIRALDRRSVAVIVPDMSNPFNVEIVRSIEKGLRSQGVIAELSCTDGRNEVVREMLERVKLEKKAAGVVLVSYATRAQFDGTCLPDLPIVTIDYCPPSLADRSIFISCDNFKGGHDVASHLIALGHKRIGCFRWGEVTPARIEGFRKGLADHGMTLEDNRIFLCEDHMKVGDGVLAFIEREKLTAVFATNDMLAMQVMGYLRANGYRIPEDISLVGYDNVMASQYLDVPLTTIEQYEEQIGQRAADNLLAAMAAPSQFRVPREILIIPTLVVRDSTAPPKF
ncbi:MAG: substrate-binding domain-containing protein [Nitrospiraceae bacterium]|nr:substrate-binding domain-containing protein [Nitrospiraceae bacterium]